MRLSICAVSLFVLVVSSAAIPNVAAEVADQDDKVNYPKAHASGWDANVAEERSVSAEAADQDDKVNYPKAHASGWDANVVEERSAVKNDDADDKVNYPKEHASGWGVGDAEK